MTSTFYRLSTDHHRVDGNFDNAFGGTHASSCWVIGGGPSLAEAPIEALRESPLPKMCINLAGTYLVRPTFWTSYDATGKFHRSIYLDPSVMKFVHRSRSMDLVPDCTAKVCDSPNLWFFDKAKKRTYDNFFSPGSYDIIDWSNSFTQAIDILYKLGFRRLYFVGCELRIVPDEELLQFAKLHGLAEPVRNSLSEFVEDCKHHNIPLDKLDETCRMHPYHFDEVKSFKASLMTDQHYFRMVQNLRLARRSISLAGMQLISVTPHSRMNDYFPYCPMEDVLENVRNEIGNPLSEPVRGLYQQTGARSCVEWEPMKDFPHPYRSASKKPRQQGKAKEPTVPPEKNGELLIEEERCEAGDPMMLRTENRPELCQHVQEQG